LVLDDLILFPLGSRLQKPFNIFRVL